MIFSFDEFTNFSNYLLTCSKVIFECSKTFLHIIIIISPQLRKQHQVREREYEVEKIDMTTHEAQQCGNSAGIIHGVRHTSFFNFPLPQFLSDGIC